MKHMKNMGSGHTVTGMYHAILILFLKNTYTVQKDPHPKVKCKEGGGKEFGSLHFLIC